MAIYECISSGKTRCVGCKWLLLDDGQTYFGVCVNRDTRIKERHRCVTDKACKHKRIEAAKGQEGFHG